MDEHALTPRARLLIALALAFAIAAVRELAMLPVLTLLAGGLALTCGQTRLILRRIRGAALLALGLVLILPLISGQTVLAQLGPLAFRLEGLHAGGLMAMRLLSVVTITLALLAPLSPFQLVGALRGLGVPVLMADLALLTLRYLDEVSAGLRRARLARQLRGGRPDWRSDWRSGWRSGWRALPDHAAIFATGLIRAQVRSDRLWAAMRLRGYGTGLAIPVAPLHARDRGAMTAAMVAALCIVWLDRTL